MIITRENIKEEASNLNDEILNLEKKYLNISGEKFEYFLNPFSSRSRLGKSL